MAGKEARSWQCTTLMIESLQPSTNCYTLSDLTMPLPPLHSVYNGSMIQTPRRSLCAAAMRTKAKQPSPSPACAATWRRQRWTEAYGKGRDTPHLPKTYEETHVARNTLRPWPIAWKECHHAHRARKTSGEGQGHQNQWLPCRLS